jgi:hypothetical protein
MAEESKKQKQKGTAEEYAEQVHEKKMDMETFLEYLDGLDIFESYKHVLAYRRYEPSFKKDVALAERLFKHNKQHPLYIGEYKQNEWEMSGPYNSKFVFSELEKPEYGLSWCDHFEGDAGGDVYFDNFPFDYYRTLEYWTAVPPAQESAFCVATLRSL